MRSFLQTAEAHGLCLLVMIGLALSLWTLRRQRNMQAAERWRERQMREELEAYARLDIAGIGLEDAAAQRHNPAEAQRSLAQRVCRMIAEKSIFPRVAMLMRNADGRLMCVGSAGVDDLTIAKLQGWGEQVVQEERQGGTTRSVRAGVASFSIPIGEWADFDREVSDWALSGKRERRKWRRAIVAPIRTGGGQVTGALVVCADGSRGKGRRQKPVPGGMERAVQPIEGLVRKLARELENDVLRDRLLRAEKLAGLGQLAGGVAHALNNPLTAVLGFAELIAESSDDQRIRKDATTIVTEALKMKETVEKLVEFWRPAAPADDTVGVVSIIDELARACQSKLAERGVQLEIDAQSEVPEVRGSRDRLRQVMEHLLNNAAQAISVARPREEDEPGHTIRVTVSHDAHSLHLIVSDTGTGFREPGRVFDPFYTTKGPEQGAGMGLSICYGIVREHGGEITAFNMHPHGAAVAIELPIRKVVSGEEKILRPVPQLTQLHEPEASGHAHDKLIPIRRFEKRSGAGGFAGTQPA